MRDFALLTLLVLFLGLPLGISIGHRINRWRDGRLTFHPVERAMKAAAPALGKNLFADPKVIVDINGRITSAHTISVMKACAKVAKRQRPTTLEVLIDSAGGVCASADIIAGLLEEFAASYAVRIIVAGQCMSAANTLLTSVPVERRYSFKDSTFMIHAARSGRRRRTSSAREYDAQSIERLKERTNIHPDSLNKVFKSGRDCHFDAEEALQLGLVGGIL